VGLRAYPARSSSQAAMAMPRYNADQTGPKIQLGGFQLGFARVAYQVPILGVVTAPPMPAAAKQTTSRTRRPSRGCLGGMEFSTVRIAAQRPVICSSFSGYRAPCT